MSVDPNEVSLYDKMSFNGFLADALNITVTLVLDNVENGIEEIKLLARPRESTEGAYALHTFFQRAFYYKS